MTDAKKLIVLFAICLICFVAFMDYTIVNTALPTIQSVFHVSVLQLQWIMNIYSLAVSATMIIFGRLGDIYGRRLIFYTGAVLLFVGSIGAGLTNHFGWLIAFRAVQAMGVSAVVTLAASIIIVIFEETAPKGLAIFGVVTAVGLAVGPTIGGFLIAHCSWRWVFLINAPLVAVAFVICLPLLGESKADARGLSVDYIGAILLVAAISCFVYGLIDGEQIGWSAGAPWVYLIVSVVLAIALWVYEGRLEDPILNLQFFKNPYFAMAGLCTSLVGAVVTVVMFFEPLFLHHVFHYSAKAIGIVLIATPVAIVLFASVLGKYGASACLKQLLFLSYCLMLVAVIIQYCIGAQTSVVWVVIALFVVGLSWTICNTLSAFAAQNAVEPHQSSLAVGVVFTLFNITAALALAIGTVIFKAVSSAHQGLSPELSFVAGQKGVYIFLFILTVLYIVLGYTQLKRQS